MNLRDKDKYAAAAWDFGMFKDCFTGNIRACDVDFIVERKGNFLVIEFKPEYDALKTGQRLLLERLSKVDKFTVLLVTGTPPDKPVAYRVFPNYTKEIPVDLDGLRLIVRFWFGKANGDE